MTLKEVTIKCIELSVEREKIETELELIRKKIDYAKKASDNMNEQKHRTKADRFLGDVSQLRRKTAKLIVKLDKTKEELSSIKDIFNRIASQSTPEEIGNVAKDLYYKVCLLENEVKTLESNKNFALKERSDAYMEADLDNEIRYDELVKKCDVEINEKQKTISYYHTYLYNLSTYSDNINAPIFKKILKNQ